MLNTSDLENKIIKSDITNLQENANFIDFLYMMLIILVRGSFEGQGQVW